MAEQSVIETEVSGLIAVSGLMLVFLPFFFDRIRQTRDRLARSSLRRLAALTWITPLLVALPATASAFGLATLWKIGDASGLVAWLTIASLALLVVYTFLIVWLESRVWRS